MLDYIEYDIDELGRGDLYLVYINDSNISYYVTCLVAPTEHGLIKFDIDHSCVLGVKDNDESELVFIGDPSDLMTQILDTTGVVEHLLGIYFKELALIKKVEDE